MNTEKLKQELNRSDHTCMIYSGEELVYTSHAKGVKPLMDYIREGLSHDNVYIADKVIGKGAAMLAKKINAKGVYTPLISTPALAYIQSQSIEIAFEKEVPYIINRTNDGQCPIESAVINETEIEPAFEKIKATIKILMAQK